MTDGHVLAGSLIAHLTQAALRLTRECESPYGLSVRVTNLNTINPQVILSEAGKLTQAGVRDIAQWLSDRSDCGTPDEALRRWVDLRPVTDQEALAEGIAVIGWGPRGTRPAWTVAVDRPNAPVRWHPSADLSVRETVRFAALRRSAAIPVRMHNYGPVAIWTCLGSPGLTSAVLCDPKTMLDRAFAFGVAPRDVLFVVSSPGAVACADHLDARRLAAELVQRHELFTLADLDVLEWL